MNDDVTLREVMAREFVGVSESDSLAGAARLMNEEEADAAVVLRGREPVGVLTGREVLGFVADGGDPGETPVSTVMADPPPAMPPSTGIAACSAELANGGGPVLVTEGEEVLGVVDARDLVAATTTLAGPADRQPADEPLRAEVGGEREEYSSQSICEVCGTLNRELANVNGQLVCADCREV